MTRIEYCGLRLFKQWPRASVETTDGDGRKRMEGGKVSRQGVSQGAVASMGTARLSVIAAPTGANGSVRLLMARFETG
jgi:hypothetical protein